MLLTRGSRRGRGPPYTSISPRRCGKIMLHFQLVNPSSGQLRLRFFLATLRFRPCCLLFTKRRFEFAHALVRSLVRPRCLPFTKHRFEFAHALVRSLFSFLSALLLFVAGHAPRIAFF